MSAPGSEAAVSPRTALTARFTAPGAEFEVVEREVRGIPMRVYAGGPQTLREILLDTAAFGELPYLVYGDERWTLRRAPAAGRRARPLPDGGVRAGQG